MTENKDKTPETKEYTDNTVEITAEQADAESVTSEPAEEIKAEPELEYVEPKAFAEEETASSAGRKTKKKKRRKSKNYLLRIAIVLGAILIFAIIANIGFFSVVGIGVAGNVNVSDDAIIADSGIAVGDSIMGIHSFEAAHKTEANPYVEKAHVKRQFPNTIVITVEERYIPCQIEYGKRYAIIDSEREVIDVVDGPLDVTILKGLDVKKASVGNEIKVKQEKLLDKYLSFIEITKNGDLYFKKLSSDGDVIYAYIYSNLYAYGYYNYVVDCIESGQLKAVVYDLYQKDKKKGKIKVTENNYCFFTQ